MEISPPKEKNHRVIEVSDKLTKAPTLALHFLDQPKRVAFGDLPHCDS
jgi:hypothetical protein